MSGEPDDLDLWDQLRNELAAGHARIVELERQNADLRAALEEIHANGWCPCVVIAKRALAGAPLPERTP